MNEIKALNDAEKRVGMLLVPFGHAGDADMDGEWFDANTTRVDELFSVTKALPFWVHHEQVKEMLLKFLPDKFTDDESIKALNNMDFESPVGRIVTLEKRDNGWWAEAIIEAVDKSRQWYADLVYQMTKEGKLFASSDAFPRTVKKADDGHIQSWALAGGSATPTPAKPITTEITVIKAVDEESPADEKSVIKIVVKKENGAWGQKAEGMCPTCQKNIQVEIEYTPDPEPELSEEQVSAIQYAKRLKEVLGHGS